MGLTVKDMRKLIAGLPDDQEFALIEEDGDTVDELLCVTLVGFEMGDEGRPRIVVRIDPLDDDDDEPLWNCGCGLLVDGLLHCPSCGACAPWGCGGDHDDDIGDNGRIEYDDDQ